MTSRSEPRMRQCLPKISLASIADPPGGGFAIPKAPPLRTRERRAIYDRDGGRCVYCGRDVSFGGNNFTPFSKTTPGHIDHRLPRSRGGQNDPGNLVLACYSCNFAKAAD